MGRFECDRADLAEMGQGVAARSAARQGLCPQGATGVKGLLNRRRSGARRPTGAGLGAGGWAAWAGWAVSVCGAARARRGGFARAAGGSLLWWGWPLGVG